MKPASRFVFNNDGGDITFGSGTEDPMDFLKVRTTPLVGSQVDTISYCSAGGFGMVAHKSQVGTLMPIEEEHRYLNHQLHALHAQGTDPLQVMVDYGHAHGMQVFWSMRMNDTHDSGRKNEPFFKANRFKQEHPECLMAGFKKRFEHRKWSAVDYDHEAVRQTGLALIEEVVQTYDVDGIELDFFRHPVFFECTSRELPVRDEQREKLTQFMRDVAAVVRRRGEARGRPFTIAVRTPDDPDYCATIGIDLDAWLRERLLDLFIPGGYFRLRPWRDSVELGHRHGIQVHAGISDTRVGGGHHIDAWRASDECYRARAANAWQAGVDGIYMFNLFNPHRRVWSELGDPDTLTRLDKLYYATNRGIRNVPRGAYPYEGFVRLSTPNPEAPVGLPAGIHETIRIEMAEDLDEAALPAMRLHILCGDPEERAALTVVFNGHLLSDWQALHGFRCFELDPTWTSQGWNTVEVINNDDRMLQIEDALVSVDYSGKLLVDTSYYNETRSRM